MAHKKRRCEEAFSDNEDINHNDIVNSESDTEPNVADASIASAGFTPDTGRSPPQVLIIHRVHCSKHKTAAEDHSRHHSSACYLDVPRLFRTDTRGHALRGLQHIQDLEEYLERHEDIVIVVYRDYECETYHEEVRREFQKQVPANMDHALFLQHRAWFYGLPKDMHEARHHVETMDIISQELVDALDLLTNENHQVLGEWNEAHNLAAPYDYFLHHRAMICDWIEKLPPPQNMLLDTMINYVQNTFESEHEEAEKLFASGIVRKEHLSKLFRAKDIVIGLVESGLQGYEVQRLQSIKHSELVLECSHWIFDGTFRERKQYIKVPWPGGSQVQIHKLTLCPLQFDQTDAKQKLLHRGDIVWSCRRNKLVTYTPRDASSFELNTTNPKYMVDLETHRYLHPEEYPAEQDSDTDMRTISAQTEEPPEDPQMLLLLPPTIRGYGFHDKKWRTLQIEFIVTEINWNTKAFDSLVLKSHKKELIHAVVTSHVEKNNAADIVDDKGNGLILLLHGPPGTGKTLTAESIAEVAQKPLYRITCGDIGTEAQDVETYLESALYIGAVWGCVVLLDEADVFLEERTPTDLARNALVSVFLRVLEHYDGILILTSNRVGLFDEAFKSRMQMAVFYPKLDERGRKEIWRNFFKALAAAKVDCNHDELQDRVHVLAEHLFNGRQIRNIIKTARQLAKFSKQKLAYLHLEKVIDVAKEFDEYLNKTRRYDDDEWAEEQRMRGNVKEK